MTGIIGLTGSSSGELGTITKAAGAAGGKHTSTQTFSATGIYTVPAGITSVYVQIVGSGGGGGGHGESGGSGGYSSEWLTVVPGATVSVTVANAGIGTTYNNVGGTGGTVSFGSYLSATGGPGGRGSPFHSGGHGGVGSGGMVNFHGGGGSGHDNQQTGIGGAGYFGGSGRGGHSNIWGSSTYDHEGSPGGGGSAAAGGNGRGAHGSHGYVVIWEYS